MFIISILSALLRFDLHSKFMSSYKINEGSRKGCQVYVCESYVYVKDKDILRKFLKIKANSKINS